MKGDFRCFDSDSETNLDIAPKPKKRRRKGKQKKSSPEDFEPRHTEDANAGSSTLVHEHLSAPPSLKSYSAGLIVPDVGQNEQRGVPGGGPSALDASVHVSNRGVQYQIGGSATVHFHYGSHIKQQAEEHYLKPAIRNLKRSHHAEYNMVTNPTRDSCTPGTRTVILQNFGNWCNSVPDKIIWMDGMAGTGKTTISYTLCEMLAKVNLLGASFFCSRSLEDCRDISIIFPTIAFQLARKFPLFAEALAETLEEDPDVLQRSLDVQVRHLLINPWKARWPQRSLHTSESLHTIVILDALDECDKDHSTFLRVLLKHVHELPFKIMFTSRPEPSIRSVLITKDLETLSTFILHEVESSLVEADIALYVESRLKECLPSLSRSDVLQLSKQCGNFFIYAATLCNFIVDEDGDHEARLESLLSFSSSIARERAVQPIDTLYIEILRQVFSDNKLPEEIDGARVILHTVVFARDPLTRDAIADLLQLSNSRVEARLKLLRSLIFVPQASNQPISIFHTSLLDFLQDSSRSKQFHFQTTTIHFDMARQCLVLVNRELRMNICQLIGRPPNSSVDPHVIQQHIIPGLRYAAAYGVEHWSRSTKSQRQSLLDLVRALVTTHRLHWFECLSLIEMLHVGIPSLEAILNGLDQDGELANLTYDSLRFIQYVYDLIKCGAMETYFSALIWTPSRSLLRTCYPSLYSQVPQVLSGFMKNWEGPNRSINIHTCDINEIVISKDGHWIVSGSDGGTVRIWNVPNQTEQLIFEGHLSSVKSVAISTQGSRVVSGSRQTILVWDTTTREVIQALDASADVLTLAMSPDEKWIASGHTNCHVCVWDSMTGRLVYSLEGHKKNVTSVSFMVDNTRLVSTSDDCTAHIWNVVTGNMENTLHGHTDSVTSVTCSPIEAQILTGSSDQKARLWDALGKPLQVLQGHSGPIRSVVFMPDGKQVVTSSDDETLRIWDVMAGVTLQILTGLAQAVRSVAVFPDGLKLASGSDNTISVWSLRNDILAGRAESVDAPSRDGSALGMAFSPSGQSILLLPSIRILDTETLEEKAVLGRSTYYKNAQGAFSTSETRVVTAMTMVIDCHLVQEMVVDDIPTGELAGGHIIRNRLKLEGHTDRVTSISFSHNDRLLVSASEDSTARVWDAVTGNQIHTLKHRRHVQSVAFSQDDTQVASSTRCNVYLWDVESGQKLRQMPDDLLARSTCIFICSATFTPDDQYIIISHNSIVQIWNAKTYLCEHVHKGYRHWTTFDDRSSYALSEDGQWICFSPRLGERPRKYIRVASQHQPTLFRRSECSGNPLVPTNFASGPLFTLSSRGVQVCLPSYTGPVTLLIPHHPPPLALRQASTREENDEMW